MGEKEIEVIPAERTDSIEVNLDKKGAPSYKIKVYYNNEETSVLEISSKLHATYKELVAKFGGGS